MCCASAEQSIEPERWMIEAWVLNTSHSETSTMQDCQLPTLKLIQRIQDRVLCALLLAAAPS